MQSPAEAIREIESQFDTESLELQISYCKAMADAYPRAERHQRLLALYTEALRMQAILVRLYANLRLGIYSPFINDAELMGLDTRQMYEAYRQYRLGIDPDAEPARRKQGRSRTHEHTAQRSPAKPRQPEQTSRAHLGATQQLKRLKSIASRIARRDSASSVEVGSKENIPTTATSKPVTSKPVASKPIAGKPVTSKPHEPTPLQPATPVTIGHRPLVIGNCGSTQLTTGGSTQLTTGGSTQLTAGGSTQLTAGGSTTLTAGGSTDRITAVSAALRIIPDYAALRQVRRDTAPRRKAGPGGACLRQAA